MVVKSQKNLLFLRNVSFVLLRMNVNHFACRMGTIMIMALFAGVVSHIPYWNWWGFPFMYVAVSVVDYTIGWLIAGWAMAKSLEKWG